MSDLYRSAISARLAKLPHLPPDENNEDDEDGEAEDSLGSLPSGMGPPAMQTSERPSTNTRKESNKPPNPAFSPVSASSFFTEAAQVAVPASNLDMRVYYTPPLQSGGSLMVFHHGAGYSGLSFACLAKEVVEMTKGECGVLALDARRHGKTTSSVSDEDLSIDVLAADFFNLLQILFPDPKSAPSFVLVGHSMGGSVVVRTCPVLQEHGYKVGGVAVLDVVEGTAIEALPHMHSLLNARPDGFGSLEEAIEWHVSTNTIHNVTSARVSIPSIIVPSTSSTGPEYVWRTPLRSTAPYWTTWFKGLSNKFLSARTARLLVLAGTDRLDKELMIGQMQGKFQMVVVPGSAVGHMLHEDDPTRVAEVLVAFWRRNERVVNGVKKVGDL